MGSNLACFVSLAKRGVGAATPASIFEATDASGYNTSANSISLVTYGLLPMFYVRDHRVNVTLGRIHSYNMLDENELRPADEVLLDLLREGRVTAPYAASETDYSLQYIRDRLTRLIEHGHVKKVHEGLYELIQDPRE